MPLTVVKQLIHTLTNKMTSALGYIDLAQTAEAEEQKKEYVTKAYRELKDAIAVLRDLLKQEIFKKK